MKTKGFELRALFAALDEHRQARGITWAEATRQISAGPRTPIRPVASSTITGIGKKAVAEADGVLSMLRWLGRSPESFVPSCPSHLLDASALPGAAPGEVLRFDTRKLHDAINAQRKSRSLTWQQFERESGAAASHARGLSRGGRTAFPIVMRITAWLNRPAADFVRRSRL